MIKSKRFETHFEDKKKKEKEEEKGSWRTKISRS